MAAIAEELTTSPYVHSPLNLNAFSKWCRTATEEELNAVMNTVRMVEHRTPPELFGIQGPPPTVTVDLRVNKYAVPRPGDQPGHSPGSTDG